MAVAPAVRLKPIVDRVLLKSEREHDPGFFITTMVARMVFGILASINSLCGL